MAEFPELGARSAKFAQADSAGFEREVHDVDDHLVVDRTDDPAFSVYAHPQTVPLSWPVSFGIQGLENIPGKYVRTLEAGKPKRTVGRVEAIVLVLAVPVKDQAGGTTFILELDFHLELVRNLVHGHLREAYRSSPKPRTKTTSRYDPSPLFPGSSHDQIPFELVEGPDGKPFFHGHGDLLLHQVLEGIGRNAKAHRSPGLDGQDGHDLAVEIKGRASTAPRLDRNGHLNHRPSVAFL